MGITYKIGTSPNQIWELENSLGLEFENWIYQAISKEISPYFEKGTRIEKTPSSNDGGKDIIISSPVDILSMLGQSFYMNGKSKIKIYIECKSTNQNSLQFEKIIGNISKVKDDEIDFFVLVTNSCIIPITYYRINEELKTCGTKFILVDQYLLAKYLVKMELANPSKIPLYCGKLSLYGEYQVVPQKENGRNVYEIYLVCRNYCKDNHHNTINLLTDKNWATKSSSFSFVISPNGGYVRKISITRSYSDGIDDLLFKLKTQETESIVHIHGTDIKEVFEPHFVGKEHNIIKNKLIKRIHEADNLQLFYLWGDAGIGKTRITQELFRVLDGQQYDFYFFSFGKNRKNPCKDISDFLITKSYLRNVDSSIDLTEIIYSASNPSRRAVIIIDDCHHAENNFFEQIKLLEKSTSPVTIILCGRTDYSEGEINYYSFVQWMLDHYPKSGWIVQPLKEEETKSLIRAMINHVPDIVLQKVYDMSMNNPLYIVQFIEYLLETKLVKLINRNTVGIINVATFSSRVSIPSKISQIYGKRLNNLLKSYNGAACLELLFLLTIFGGDLSSMQIMDFIDEDLNVTQELLDRRFIKRGENRNFIFIHESMFIFFKDLLLSSKKYKKQISQYVFSKNDLFLTQLSDYDIARLALWKNDVEKSKKYFNSAINILFKIDNYSNYNINIGIYNYLYDIYELYKGKKSNIDLLKKIISARVYITLHYLAPINAISECEYGLMLLEKSAIFKDEQKFKYTLLSLKAHSLLNAGKLSDGELILKELQSKWLISPDYFDTETLFDIMDRLSSIYIKYNCFELALNYCNLELSIAEKFKDNSLTIIAHRTRSKLYFYNDNIKCKDSLDKANVFLQNGSSTRIYEDNALSELLFEMQNNKSCNWKQILNDAIEIKKRAFDNSFYKSFIRSYTLLSVSQVKLANDSNDLLIAKKLIQEGIDASIRFGIPSHIWQFYNLLAIVDMKLNYESDHVLRLFETVFSMLASQNLLYIGNRDFCFCNVMAISNVGFFLHDNGFESNFINKMSSVTYTGYSQLCNYDCGNSECGYICMSDTAYLNKQYTKAGNKQLLFIDQIQQRLLRDESTKYFIPLS
ncbi:MAG: ATP-binding protein [Oscillospiraceae bacterium]|nr:ATP-binding protein [Oscillospiraceae bacterium]